MIDTYKPVRDFEAALCEYTGAPYAVTVTSCTMALLLAVAYFMQKMPVPDCILDGGMGSSGPEGQCPNIQIPARTYVSVPMSIIHAGGWPCFRNESWRGAYQLQPLPVWDCARRFTGGMYVAGQMQCVSFHWSKILGVSQGGAILLDDSKAAAWLRMARFDGRTEGVAPKDDAFTMIGWHCYLSPEVAAAALMRLALLPDHNADLLNDDYPDLSQMEIFE